MSEVDKSDKDESYRGEVWYGCVIRVSPLGPHPVYQDLAEIEQHCNLSREYQSLQNFCNVTMTAAKGIKLKGSFKRISPIQWPL